MLYQTKLVEKNTLHSDTCKFIYYVGVPPSPSKKNSTYLGWSLFAPLLGPLQECAFSQSTSSGLFLPGIVKQEEQANIRDV